jgi:Cd2+/Zn2+-exporting ATPase
MKDRRDHEHGHECAACGVGNGHEKGEESRLREIIELSLALLIFGSGFLVGRFSPVAFIAAYLLAGYGIIYGALRDVLRGKAFGENLLITIASIGAIAVREIPEAAAVMLFFRVGEFLEEMAVDRSRRSIKAILDVRPDRATVILEDGTVQERSPQTVEVGEVILVKPGERMPLDGEVVEGVSAVDQSPITGESIPIPVNPGSTVYSGSVNLKGALKVRVERPFQESTVSRILRLVEEAGERKAQVERFITRFARVYTPAVVSAAFLTATIPPLLGFGPFGMWVYRALIFLVISCPCALVISIPLGIFGGIGGAARKGILVKGGNYLEALSRIDGVVFDKTGTLTMGVFELQKISPFNGFSESDTLKYAVMAERLSDHPVATAITNEWKENLETLPEVEDFEEIAGKGVKATSGGAVLHAGNVKLLDDLGIEHVCKEPGTVVHVVKDGVLVGEIVVSDRVKEDVRYTVRELKRMGVKGIYMLTGDKREIADQIGREFGFDEVYAELLPHEKVERFEEIKKRHNLVAFVGDGINDAPVIARADIGVAMGGIGRDAAVEVADVVIATDEPSKMVAAVKVARKTRRIVWENIIFSISVKFIFLSLGFMGMATMWEAIFADVGVAILAIFNSLRAMFRT